MIPFRRRDDPYMLVVRMTGVKMGDRVALVGCAHGGRLAAIASKVGISGRAVAIVFDEASAARARKGAANAGVLVEVEVAAPPTVPAETAVFDLAVVDDTAGMFATMRAEDRIATVAEVRRILRPGGRGVVVGAAARGGVGALFSRAPAGPAFDPAPSLETAGFTMVRMLGEREGLRFVEGVKPRT
jgi:SAM-dependent methyltransferase